jgi:hypothetical protein
VLFLPLDPGWKKIQIQDIFANFLSVFWLKNTYSLTQIRIRDLVNPRSGIRDGKFGSGILDPGSGINIPDPQHCYLATGERSKSGTGSDPK